MICFSDFDKVFFWGDTHFGHEHVMIECNRPWNNTNRMDQALIDNARSVVGDADLLIHVGDLTMFGTSRAQYMAKIVEQLPGANVLVLGNHDRFKPEWYLKHGFDMVATSMIIFDSVLVVHDPAEVAKWPLSRPVICGHVHDCWQSKGNVVNVGVDSWNFKPVELSTIWPMLWSSKRDPDIDWKKVSMERHNKEK